MDQSKIFKSICPVSGQTPKEERINSLTHGLGALLSVGALCALVVSASNSQNAWHIISSCVFGASLVLLYLASTLYHASTNPKIKRKLKIFDHACIYVLIAGTYTPFTLGPLHGPWGWSLFCVIWGLAICGIVFKLFFTGRFRLVSTLIYMGVGSIGLVAVSPLAESLPTEAFYGIFAGGLSYTLGTVFYLVKRIPYHHGLWHLSVLGGSTCHFFTVLLYVVV